MSFYLNNKVNYIYSFVGALLTSFMMSTMSISCVWNYDSGYDNVVVFFCALYSIGWFGLSIGYLISSKQQISARRVILFVIFTIPVIFFIENSFWNAGYISLNPIADAIYGKLNADTGFYAAITGGIRSYGYPTLLVNGAKYINYHTLSNYVCAIICEVVGIPSILTYSFIIPIIFSSLFIFVLITVCARAKYVLSSNLEIGVADIIFIYIFVSGCLPQNILSVLGIWKQSTINSETFLVSAILVLEFINLTFRLREKIRENDITFIFIIVPVFVFLITFAKISSGVMLTVFIMTYLIQKHFGDVKYLGACILYLFVLYICSKLFSGTSLFQGLGWLPFMEQYGGGKNNFFVYFILVNVATLTVLYYRLKGCRLSLTEFILCKDYAVEKSLIVLAGCSVAPGMLMPIGGGSAAYFAFCSSLIAIVFLIGYDIPSKMLAFTSQRGMCRMVPLVIALCMGWSLVCNANVKSLINEWKKTMENISGRTAVQSSIWNNIREINELTKGKKKDYALYLDASAELFDIYGGSMKEVFFYPAMTDLLCLNITYEENSNFFDARDNIVAPSWNLFYGFDSSIPRERKKTFDEVMKTIPENIRYVIILENKSYRVIEAR